MADVILLHYNLYGYVLVCFTVNFLQYFRGNNITFPYERKCKKTKNKKQKKSLCSDRRFKIKVKRSGDTISLGETKTKQINRVS